MWMLPVAMRGESRGEMVQGDIVTGFLLAVLAGIVGGVASGILVLVADHRLPWFSRWLHHGEMLDSAAIASMVEQIHELQTTAKRIVQVAAMPAPKELHDKAFEDARLPLERLKGSEQLSVELRNAIEDLIAAAAVVIVNEQSRHELGRAERLQSRDAAQASLSALLALAEKELSALKRRS